MEDFSALLAEAIGSRKGFEEAVREAARSMASTLKELIEDGIVERKQYNEIPPRVEYRLSEKGLSVVPILRSICKWSGAYHKEDNENTLLQCQKCDFIR